MSAWPRSGTSGPPTGEEDGLPVRHPLGEGPQAPSKLLARVVQFGSDVLGERHQVGVALTPQEFRLLGLLALGYSYQAAGEELGISVNTVRNYIRSIYEKLHVHSKSEAVGKALRQHLID